MLTCDRTIPRPRAAAAAPLILFLICLLPWSAASGQPDKEYAAAPAPAASTRPAPAAATAPAPTTAPAPAGDEAAALPSLLLSAQRLLAAQDAAPARAARLATLLEYAHALAPRCGPAARLLAEVRLAEGSPDQAAEALQVALADQPNDHALELQILALRLRKLQTAQQRLDFLRQITDSPAEPVALRAQAAVESAAIYANRGLDDPARDCFKKALELDARHPIALAGLRRSQAGPASAPASQPASAPATQPTSQPAPRLVLTARPVRPAITVGEGLAVEVELRNEGGQAFPLSAGGAFAPVVTFQAGVKGGGEKLEKPFTNLPLLPLPAPAYLEAGQSVRAAADLDVGRLHEYLAARPLEDVEVTVTAEVRGLGLKAPPLRLVRAGLLRPGQAEPAQADQEAVLGIVRDIKRGSVEAKMRAARQVGSLLKMHEAAAGGKIRPAAPLAQSAQKPMMLSMMRAMLADPSAAVRAEMIAALLDLHELDATMIELLGPAWKDSSSLVRLRVLELYLTVRPAGWEAAAAALGGDPDPCVRRLAAVK